MSILKEVETIANTISEGNELLCSFYLNKPASRLLCLSKGTFPSAAVAPGAPLQLPNSSAKNGSPLGSPCLPWRPGRGSPFPGTGCQEAPPLPHAGGWRHDAGSGRSGET